MDGNGQLVQFPYPMEQGPPLSWAPPSLPICATNDLQQDVSVPTNAFHMPCLDESGTCQEEKDSAAAYEDASEMAGEICFPPNAPDEPHADIPTSNTDSLPDDVVALGNPRQMLANAGLATEVTNLLDTSSPAKR